MGRPWFQRLDPSADRGIGSSNLDNTVGQRFFGAVQTSLGNTRLGKTLEVAKRFGIIGWLLFCAGCDQPDAVAPVASTPSTTAASSTKPPLGSHTKLRPIALQSELRGGPLSKLPLEVTIENSLSQDLDCDAARIFASYRIFDSKGRPVTDPPSLRTSLHTIRVGRAQTVEMLIQAPRDSGTYRVQLSMVHEGVSWAADDGAPGSELTLIVD